jgi:DNA-binding XRE family transcriptional regulator
VAIWRGRGSSPAAPDCFAEPRNEDYRCCPFCAWTDETTLPRRQFSTASQEEVAHRAGIHVTYLSGIERGTSNPSLKNIRRVALALNVPVTELFASDEPAP